LFTAITRYSHSLLRSWLLSVKSPCLRPSISRWGEGGAQSGMPPPPRLRLAPSSPETPIPRPNAAPPASATISVSLLGKRDIFVSSLFHWTYETSNPTKGADSGSDAATHASCVASHYSSVAFNASDAAFEASDAVNDVKQPTAL
jgi:hypothetical protein